MTNIKEVIHLYLGCEVERKGIPGFAKLTGVSYDDTTRTLWCYFENEDVGYCNVEDCTLRLRRLDSMTKDEAAEIEKMNSISDAIPCPFFNNIHKTKHGLQLLYLLKQGFWLFGDEAFEQGLIIDKNLKP